MGPAFFPHFNAVLHNLLLHTLAPLGKVVEPPLLSLEASVNLKLYKESLHPPEAQKINLNQAALVFFGLVDALSHLIHLGHILLPGHLLASPELCPAEVSRLLSSVADLGRPKNADTKKKKSTQKNTKCSQATLHLSLMHIPLRQYAWCPQNLHLLNQPS